MVYSNDVNSNVKIVKLQNPQKNYAKKKTFFPDKKEVAKKIIEVVKKSVSEQYHYKPFHNSSLFSKNTKGILIFSQPNSRTSFSAVHILPFDFQSAKIQISNLKIIYDNPLVAIRYFNGKHSVRPPTLFS